MIASPSELATALPDLLSAPVLGLDIETAGPDGDACLDPRRGRIRLVQLATPGRVYVVDCFSLDRRALGPLFEHANRIIGHNLRFDLGFLAEHGLPIPDGTRLLDTMLAEQVLDGGQHADAKHRGHFSLAAVSRRRLGVSLSKDEQRSDWSVPDLRPEQIAYAATDVAILLPLADTLDQALRSDGLGDAALIEMRCLPGIVWLQRSGVLLDTQRWSALTDAAGETRDRLRAELEDLAGRPLNPNSPKQVQQVLHELGIGVQNTDADTLAGVADRHPLVAKLLAYRESAKLAGTYGANILATVHPISGRIHAEYLQIGAASGRMACSRPNLQNIPRAPAYRACFRARRRVLVRADFSQIELRIAAELTGDQRMLEAYRRGEDLHAVTAAAVLGKAPESVSREDRQLAKALNFGLLYGMGAPTLQRYALTNYGVSLGNDEAGRFRDRFFANYPAIRRWHRGQSDGAVDTRTLGAVCGGA